MKVDLSVNTENQNDIEDAINVLLSLAQSEARREAYCDMTAPEKAYICKTSVGIANIIEEDEGIYRILEGSVVAKETSPSCSAKTKKLREQLISNGTIEIVGDKGIVRKDIGDLLSKSLVASIVTGTNTNGNARLIEKTPAEKNTPFKGSYETSSKVKRSSIPANDVEEIRDLYRRVRDFLGFLSRNDIPDEMMEIYNFHREGLDEIHYELQVKLIENGVELPQVDFKPMNISLFDSLTKAYTWLSDSIRVLDRIYAKSNGNEGFDEYNEVCDALKRCIVLCCKDM